MLLLWGLGMTHSCMMNKKRSLNFFLFYWFFIWLWNDIRTYYTWNFQSHSWVWEGFRCIVSCCCASTWYANLQQWNQTSIARKYGTKDKVVEVQDRKLWFQVSRPAIHKINSQERLRKRSMVRKKNWGKELVKRRLRKESCGKDLAEKSLRKVEIRFEEMLHFRIPQSRSTLMEKPDEDQRWGIVETETWCGNMISKGKSIE